MNKHTAVRAIANAKAHAPKASMHSSAVFCIKDAEACLADGQFQHAFDWAVRSLGYSVGVFEAKAAALRAPLDEVRTYDDLDAEMAE